MAKGKSGRIVLEVDPILKRKLYLILEAEQVTLKEWFVSNASNYVSQKKKLMNKYNLFVAEGKEDYF